MAEIEIKTTAGKSAGKYQVSEGIVNAKANMVSIHRAVVAEEANSRQGTQSAKTRSEVRGGGKKPYKQKKTGNARQGTTRAPHYTHGGVAMAVKPRDYTKKVNRRERRGAILAALSAHLENDNVTIVDAISFTEPKTKLATELLTAVGLKDQRRVLVILPSYDLVTYKCFRNLPNVTVRTAPANGTTDAKTAVFSARDLLVAQKIVVAKEALAQIEEVWAK